MSFFHVQDLANNIVVISPETRYMTEQWRELLTSHISPNINIIIYHYISSYIIIYHYISSYNVFLHGALYIIIYISLYIIIYHYMSLYIIIYHYIPLYIIIYHHTMFSHTGPG